MTYPSPRKLQLRRGNTAQISSYTGPIGEIVINTDTWALYIQDGTTVGGHIVSGGGGGGTNYSNANVLSYLTSFNGNIIPSANVTYTLGNITHQWKSLYVSNNTIYINGVPLTVDASGNLSINGSAISTVAYVNTQVANVNLTNYALNANVTAANVGLKGYVDQANTIQSAQIASANLGLKGYVDQANTIQSAQVGAANLAITTANLGMKGYVDSQSFYSNVKVATYLPTYTGNIAANITKGSYTWTFEVNGSLTTPGSIFLPGGIGIEQDAGSLLTSAPNDIILSAGTNGGTDSVSIKTNQETHVWEFGSDGTLTFPNSSLSIYHGMGDNIQTTDNLFINALATTISAAPDGANLAQVNLSDSNVVIRSVSNNITDYQWTFGKAGDLTFPDSTVQTTAYSNAAVSTYLASHIDQTFGANVTIQGNLFVNGNITYISVNNVAIGDNIINLADLNPADSLDLGLSAHRTVGGIIQHTGLVRDASANQWRLFSNVVAQPGTTVDFTDAIYDDIQVGNITSPTITALTLANTIQGQQLAAANVGIIGYIDQGNTIQAAAIVAANVGLKGYVDSRKNFDINGGYINFTASPAAGTDGITFSDGSFQTTAYTGYGNVQVGVFTNLSTYAYAANVTAANVGMKGYVDNKILNQEINSGYINFSASPAIGTNGITFNDGSFQTTAYTGYGNVQVGVYTNLSTYAWNANVTAANVGMKGYVDSQSFYSNTRVATYLQVGNIANVSVAGNITATYFIGNGALLTGIVAGGSGTNYSNVNVQAYTESMGFKNYSNVNVAAYLNATGYNLYSNVNVQAYLSGSVTGIVPASAYSNNLGTNTKPWGNFYTYNMELAGGYFKTNGTGGISGQILKSTGDTNPPAWSNIADVISGSTGNFSFPANVTAQNFIGNISITGNVVGTSPNVTIQAGGNVWIFDNTGNLTLPTNADIIGAVTFTGNVTAPYFIGNGALLTGIAASSNYSNVNVATYLPTYSGNIANIRLGPSGVLTFADGTTQITAGGGSYSNVQVAAYLTTGISTAAPQIQFTNATSNYIKYNNVGVGAPTFTTSNVGTRIIYWSSVDANTADYAVGIDAGTLWHGIPRATSGFAFKWYGGTTQIAMLEGTGLFTVANIKLSPSGNIMFPDGTTMTSAAAGTYSNVQVATYLPTYSGNVANIRLGVAGVLTFADGTTMTSAAAGTYSNVQVATYLPTYTGSLNASNILVTSANITIANIQATTAATNPGTGALRVMGGVGVAGAVVAGQLNSTGNVVANAISAYSLNTVANVVASLVNAGNVNASGNILAQNLIGMIATASQTNITAVGVLGNLTVTGNVTSSNFVGLTPNVQLIANTSITTFDIYGNVTFPGNNVISSLGITMPTRPAFRVNGVNPGSQSTADVNLKGSAISTVYNQGNYFDATTGKFTAPVAGIYEVLLNARVNSSYNGLAQLVVLKNGLNSAGNVIAFWETTSNAAGATHFGVSGTVVLASGDYLSANILSGNVTFDNNDNWSVTYLG